MNQAYVGSADDERIEAAAATKIGDFYTNPIFSTNDTLAYFTSDLKRLKY